ncbi:hypothetical protein PR048_013010 [Dryococelus australis]|uniref:Uncharacterized protein n=1 Tax=Dryococelus australis TaxID=614101 RepID=A0ABQ9HQZ4_9NEOP|nr:hypothetical protein PR048_013010 [Dryococelus australis]
MKLYNVVNIKHWFLCLYYLEDQRGEPIVGGYYTEEIQPTKFPDVYLVEVLKRCNGHVYLPDAAKVQACDDANITIPLHPFPSILSSAKATVKPAAMTLNTNPHFARRRGSVLIRQLSFHLGEPKFDSLRRHSQIFASGNCVGRKPLVFSRITHFPRPFIPVLLYTHLASPPSALKT